jgi:hypothetical protein
MTYNTIIEGGQTFTQITGFIRAGDDARTFLITEAWNGGFVAYTTDGKPRADVCGVTAIQAWRKLSRILKERD